MSAFLGPHGKATVILMTAHFESELPKLKDLKKSALMFGRACVLAKPAP